jgi:hypothetical protein
MVGGCVVPGGFSTGVAKKGLSIANLVVEKAAKLDCDTLALAWPWAVGQGSWQRRLEEIGGIKPLAFGRSVWGDGARPRSAPC